MKGKVGLLIRRNMKWAKVKWFGELGEQHLQTLRTLTEDYGLMVALGDLLLIEGRWYVTLAALLRIAQRRKCIGIETAVQDHLSNPKNNQWVIKATVFKSRSSKRFVGYGDADPTNVSSMVRGAELRVAESRAVCRALRKAYGIGLCSVEELGAYSSHPRPSTAPAPSNGTHPANGTGSGSSNGQPRLRDQLCLLIRHFNLDPNLVKAYAADFCGTESLSGASRDLVESFISHLSSAAKENRDALVCKLNSYLPPVEARS